MAVLNPEHLLDQARRLIAPPRVGAPRQADIRRAISVTYYAAFHYILTRAADQIIGKTKRNDNLYALVYRSVDHRRLKDICVEFKKPIMPDKFKRYLDINSIGENIQAFSSAIIDLQEKRNSADYDPTERVTIVDALFAIEIARRAIRGFEHASEQRQKAFLTLLLFSPR